MRRSLPHWSMAVTLCLLSASAWGQSGKTVTLVGCIEPEEDYRSRLEAAKGRQLGSGLGQADEYVLSSAKPVPSFDATQDPNQPVGTSGQLGDYLLTGAPRSELDKAVGREVEIVGVVEPRVVTDSAKEPRESLPRLTVSTWQPVGEFCQAATQK